MPRIKWKKLVEFNMQQLKTTWKFDLTTTISQRMLAHIVPRSIRNTVTSLIATGEYEMEPRTDWMESTVIRKKIQRQIDNPKSETPTNKSEISTNKLEIQEIKSLSPEIISKDTSPVLGEDFSQEDEITELDIPTKQDIISSPVIIKDTDIG